MCFDDSTRHLLPRIEQQALEHAEYLNQDICPAIVPTETTLSNKKWIVDMLPTVREDTIALCRMTWQADTREYLPLEEVNPDGLCILFTAEALATTAILGPLKSHRPHLYISPQEIATWQKEYSVLSMSFLRQVIIRHRTDKASIPRILTHLANLPPDLRWSTLAMHPNAYGYSWLAAEESR